MYTVQSGDTLAGIAASLWGDANLWYKIAEVNGLTAESALIEGQPLIIPVGVQRNSNTAETFKPYDPLEVLGNVSPTSPAPKKNKCGAMGQILIAVIAIVVVAIVAPHAIAWVANLGPGANVAATSISATLAEGGIAAVAAMPGVGAAAVAGGGAIAGAAGSIVSQGIGVMTGIQEKFSWNAVGLAAIGGAIGGAGKLGVGGSQWHSVAARAMVANALTQGIGVATGMQKDFSWAGVAAAGVGVAVGANFNVASPLNVVGRPSIQDWAESASRIEIGAICEGTVVGAHYRLGRSRSVITDTEPTSSMVSPRLIISANWLPPCSSRSQLSRSEKGKSLYRAGICFRPPRRR